MILHCLVPESIRLHGGSIDGNVLGVQVSILATWRWWDSDVIESSCWVSNLRLLRGLVQNTHIPPADKENRTDGIGMEE